ncbi:protoporphyrinogen oxidase HemJ [Gilvimarinus algae]|uniref:Protoporphyrinogen IX oxidase n=1 Tax=Gilvimarinus algae TaxID=3058037 RepID=A0ABT8THN0_9GAMM|nr:protoporphyrinogen oxidase HemJ [Gilvimarinus sp. SDUM040014]MDO3383421.1 protoporphyrinogen oxidase HemJ [Gilvimarinus sp. SDUM040014]
MLWIKALHIIAVICWFAALFYLPRLFVYHAMSEDSTSRERFKIMERKLYRGIATPSMIATLLFGGALVHYQWELIKITYWFWVKMALVIALVGYHHLCGVHLKRFALDANQRSHTYFRVFNELPVFALVAIVILVVVKPF